MVLTDAAYSSFKLILLIASAKNGGITDHKGTALQHKEPLVMTSTGGPNEAYTWDGANLYPLETLLSPFRAMANKTGMTWLNPVPLHGANGQRRQ